MVSSSSLHRCLWLIVAVLALALLPSAASAASWTVLVYLNADNNLDGFGMMDLNEMEAAPANANVNVVVQIDRVAGNGAWDDARRYLVRHDTNPGAIGSELLSSLGEVNMGSPGTLIDFVEWGMVQYHADRYLLVLWDHGSGWKAAGLERVWKGIIYDDSSGDYISTPELGAALRQIKNDTGRKLDIVACDACLMGMVELAYEVKDGASYWVAAEETIPGYGFPYDQLLASLAENPSMSAVQLSQAIVNTYCASYSPGGSQYDGWPVETCLSGVDLTKIDDVEIAVDNFAVAASNAMDTLCEDLLPALWQSQRFFDPDYHDLYDMANRVHANVADTGLQGAAAQVTAAVSAAVVANGYVGESEAGAHGIAIYYPDASEYLSSYSSLAFAASSHWDEFISTEPPCSGGRDDEWEPDDLPEQASTLLSGHTQVNHWFGSEYDVDWVKLAMRAGRSYVMETKNLGPDCDTWIFLFDASVLSDLYPEQIADNDDIDPPINIASRLFWQASSTGNYYLGVIDYWGSSGPTANYDLFFAEISFVDVPWDNWAFGFIEACVTAGVVQGYAGDVYHPTNLVTRDQMAVYIARAVAGGDGNVTVPSGVAEPSFSDVAEDYWAYKYVEYCRDRGVVGGYPDGSYQPTKPVDRGQMAVFIARAMANPIGDVGLAGYVPPSTPTFPDVTPSTSWAWAVRYVEYIKEKHVSEGYPDGLYHPERTVTRDQMAVYIARAFHLMD